MLDFVLGLENKEREKDWRLETGDWRLETITFGTISVQSNPFLGLKTMYAELLMNKRN
jgi:hypothetical protein